MQSPSRRALLKSAVVFPVAAVAVGEAVKDAVRPAQADPPNFAEPSPRFFTSDEIAFIDAAVAQIIPADDLGPGAKEAGVTTFIDGQLGGPYGRAETWYMQGPWREGTKEQGYQLKLTPAQLYRVSIRDINDYCRQHYSGKSFAQLDRKAQEEVLNGIDKGEINLANAPVRGFFEMLVRNTIEGFLADPLYGGNRDFAGWKLIGFPGPRYNYVAEIEQHGKKYEMPFVSIAGRDSGLRRV